MCINNRSSFLVELKGVIVFFLLSRLVFFLSFETRFIHLFYQFRFIYLYYEFIYAIYNIVKYIVKYKIHSILHNQRYPIKSNRILMHHICSLTMRRMIEKSFFVILLNRKKERKRRKNFQIILALLQSRLKVRFVASSFEAKVVRIRNS